MNEQINEPKKLELTSMNITAEQKTKLKQLFPEVFNEGKIDFDKLKRTLGEEIDTGEERYGMNWPGKNDCFKVIQTPSIAALKPCKDESVNFDDTENLFIEGDNLEVLKLLQRPYYGKIKMIYIDPPYNTGNEFIYPDNYTESLETYLTYSGQLDEEGKRFSTNTQAEGRFHSKWMNMMYPRLFLARNLLRDDGVIFISIDDNEVHNLRMIMNEIFGEENFLSGISWKKRSSPDARATIGSVHDYILCYLKQGDQPKIAVGKMPLSEKRKSSYSNPDNDPRGPWASVDMTGMIGRATKDQFFKVNLPNGKIVAPPKGRSWGLAEATYKKLRADNRIWFGENGGNVPRIKNFLSESEGQVVPSFWDMDEAGSNDEASKEVADLLGALKIFDTPKPYRLINRMLQIATSQMNDDIILDFFAGSCTTTHAAMTLNAEDGGNRKFIMVQLPETCDQKSEAYKAGFKTIADIGKERIRRVIKKIKQEQAEKQKDANGKLPGMVEDQAKLDLGFRVFKLDKSNFNIWDGTVDETGNVAQKLELFIDHIDSEASDEDILYEILLKSGFELTTKIETLTLAGKTVYSIADKALLICLDRKLTKEVITEMADLQPARVVCLDAGFADNDQLKTNAVQIMKSHDVEDFRTV